MAHAADGLRDVVLVDGVRTPFLRSGTAYADLMAYDLARMALKGLMTRTGIDPAIVERVILGSVIQDVETSNVAREAALGAGIPRSVPAHSVTMACISSSVAVTSAADAIRLGQLDVAIAGGTETLSDIPIRFKKSVRKRLFQARKVKSPAGYARLLAGLGPSDFLPDVPDIAEFSTGETMGESADRLAALFDISREAQDEYALRSHQCAARATDDGRMEDQLVPAMVPPTFEPVFTDNGVRPDTTMEKLAQLRPAFVRPYGTVTAGNSSYLTDGASACLLASRERAEELGFEPEAYLRQYLFVAQDPGEELLLGPAYAIPRLLDRAGLELADIDVFELHEAFAGQVLAVLAALESESFARENLGREAPVGEIPMDRLNILGGSLSLGHPFGATGARLVMTAADRLRNEDGRLALVAACAAGGQGHAMLLERFD